MKSQFTCALLPKGGNKKASVMLLLLLVCTVWHAGFPKAVPTQPRQLWVQRSYEPFAFRVVPVGFGSVCVFL